MAYCLRLTGPMPTTFFSEIGYIIKLLLLWQTVKPGLVPGVVGTHSLDSTTSNVFVMEKACKISQLYKYSAKKRAISFFSFLYIEESCENIVCLSWLQVHY